jgi:single-strand DNA-binding protein
MMDFKGKVKRIGTEQQVSEKFRKRELVIEADSEYPNVVLFEFTQDKCSLLDGLQVGEQVTVHFNLRGREWTNPQGEVKVFNTVQGWKVESSGQTTSVPAQATAVAQNDGDLPF